MALARAATLIRSDLATRIRRESNDPATDAGGRTYPAEQLRFSATEIQTALEDQLLDMANEIAGFSPGQSLKSADAALDSDGVVAVPTPIALGSSMIFQVQQISGTFAIPLQYVSPLQIEGHEAYLGLGRPCYTIEGGTDVTTAELRIKVRPKISGTIRVWYVAPPTLPAADNDAIGSSDRWREVIVLGAALKLLRRDDEATQQQQLHYAHLWSQYTSFARRFRGRQRIGRSRRGI